MRKSTAKRSMDMPAWYTSIFGTGEWQHLKLSPIAMAPHKSRKYRAILDLSFHLKLFDMELPLGNATTLTTTPLINISRLGKVLPHIIETIANAPANKGSIMFSKLDIKSGYWRMMVQQGCHLNFANHLFLQLTPQTSAPF